MADRYPLIVDSSSTSIKELPAGDALIFADNDKIKIGTGSDLTLYHDATNSYITNAVGALKIATETSGIAVTIGHTTSETTIADNLVVAGDIDLAGSIDVDGTMEADAITLGGVTLAETIADTVGAMVSSNTETNIAVTYEDGDNTLDFVIGTLNQNTTGTAATVTGAAQTAITSVGTLTSLAVSGDQTIGSAFGTLHTDFAGNAYSTTNDGILTIGSVSGDHQAVLMLGNNNIGDGSEIGSITFGSQSVKQASITATYNSGGNGHLYFGTNDGNTFGTKMILKDDGNLYIGQTASSGVRGLDSKVQVSGTDLATSSLVLHRYQAGAYGPGLGFAKSRHGTVGSHTIVQDDDVLGFLAWYSSDGADFVHNSAEISCQVDGTPGSNDVPGRLTFSTTADGAASASERMRITEAGDIGIGCTPGSGTRLEIRDSANSAIMELSGTDGRGLKLFTRKSNYPTDSGNNDSGVVYDAQDTEASSIYGQHIFQTGGTTRMQVNSLGVDVATSARITQTALTSSSAAVAWDAKAKANAYHVTTENTTFSAPSNAVEGAIISVEIAQGGTARTIAWNTVFEFAASTAPTVTATASKTDIFSFRYNGSVWQEIGRVQNMAQT